jgi:ABC-type spermidine/putrescine transport system permease subunit II
VERTLLSAAFDSSANYWRITVLNLKLSIIGAALLIFTLSMDEIVDNVGLTFLPGL